MTTIDTYNNPQLFINRVDEQTRENILALGYKLRLMRAEVESKLACMTLYKGNDPESYEAALLGVEQEIKSALEGIGSLVNVVLDTDQPVHSILKGQSMEEFSQMIAEHLDKVAELKHL
jgi:hypothetical protein